MDTNELIKLNSSSSPLNELYNSLYVRFDLNLAYSGLGKMPESSDLPTILRTDMIAYAVNPIEALHIDKGSLLIGTELKDIINQITDDVSKGLRCNYNCQSGCYSCTVNCTNSCISSGCTSSCKNNSNCNERCTSCTGSCSCYGGGGWWGWCADAEVDWNRKCVTNCHSSCSAGCSGRCTSTSSCIGICATHCVGDCQNTCISTCISGCSNSSRIGVYYES